MESVLPGACSLPQGPQEDSQARWCHEAEQVHGQREWVEVDEHRQQGDHRGHRADGHQGGADRHRDVKP